MGLAIVTRIPSLVEAQIAAGALRSAGIAAEVFDGNFGGMEAPVIEGLGGYRLMAPEDEVASAREVLRQLKASPRLVDPEDGPWRAERAHRDERWQVRGFRLIVGAFLAIPVVVWILRLLSR